MEFLYRLHAAHKEDALHQARKQMLSTAKTVVVGRGPAAFDAARLSLRLGSETYMVFEGPEEQAGVDDDVLKESREEGLQIHSMRVLEIVGDDHGFAQGVKCRKLDEEPVVLEARTVIIANGHRPNNFLKQALPQLKWGEDGSLWSNEQTGMTSMEKVFGAGSVMTAGGSVVGAIAGGKAVAQKIIQYLNK
jgi:thioredoxin reductase